MNKTEHVESRIDAMLTSMDRWPALCEFPDPQPAVGTSRPDIPDAALIDKFASDPYSLSRFR
ncbi:hypothetical protein OKW43_003777 [Paraburkholderia sp. WC7.3g]